MLWGSAGPKSDSTRTPRSAPAMPGTGIAGEVDSIQPGGGVSAAAKGKERDAGYPPEKIGFYLRAAEEHGVLPMFYLELTTGLRGRELVALRWSDLNVKEQTLSVSKSAGRINGEVKVTQPKTANSMRAIYLPKETVDLPVEEHRKHIFNKYMFPSPVTGRCTARTA